MFPAAIKHNNDKTETFTAEFVIKGVVIKRNKYPKAARRKITARIFNKTSSLFCCFVSGMDFIITFLSHSKKKIT
jgi:hypothetical protein